MLLKSLPQPCLCVGEFSDRIWKFSNYKCWNRFRELEIKFPGLSAPRATVALPFLLLFLFRSKRFHCNIENDDDEIIIYLCSASKLKCRQHLPIYKIIERRFNLCCGGFCLFLGSSPRTMQNVMGIYFISSSLRTHNRHTRTARSRTGHTSAVA